MTQEEQLVIITRVAKRLAPKYTFGYYGVEDIEQEAILMGYEALPRWDESRPLENFIFRHIDNRLKTFKRDRFFRLNSGSAEKYQTSKKNLMEPVSIDNFNPTREEDLSAKLQSKEVTELINIFLPVKYRKDYLRLCAGVKISKTTKTKIAEELKRILGGIYGKEEG